MPGGDGTGPQGLGSMTGRAAGYCAGYQTPGFANPVVGRGFGRGRGPGPGQGFGRGFAYPYVPTTAPAQEADMLKAQAEGLSSALEDVNKRISELESQARKKD